ncbi:hypothetical protein R1flu_028005 [Riccia fluitans]|uniref:Maturase K n=1 Tax=Riccia fluitans TaxID=41844 RepID=A0ABD1XKH4_9MARC
MLEWQLMDNSDSGASLHYRDTNSSSKDEVDSDNDIDDLFEVWAMVSGSRYVEERVWFQRSTEFMERFFINYLDSSFRQVLRMDKRTFLKSLDRLKDHSIFHNESSHPQAPVVVQLVVALDRLGHEENGVCIE